MTLTEKHILPHILKLTKKFIAVPSTADNHAALKHVLQLAKKELQGYFPIEEYESNGIPSLLIHNTNHRTKHFKIILNAHLDIVSGKTEQYFAIEKDGKLYGRGSYDMKAAAAVMIILFREIAKKIPYPLALQLVTDEENGGENGTNYQIEKGLRGNFVITGEGGSSFTIKNESKGILYIKLTTKGVSSHSAYPWLGENAVTKMHHIIKKISEKYPVPTEPAWKTIANIVNIETSNDAFNKIPQDCSLYVDVRYIKEDKKTILEDIKNLLPPDISLKVLQNTPPAYIHEKNGYVKKLQEVAKKVLEKEVKITGAHASSDIRHYLAVNCEGVEFGPFGMHHHSDNEWVDIKSLEYYYDILKNFLVSVKS